MKVLIDALEALTELAKDTERQLTGGFKATAIGNLHILTYTSAKIAQMAQRMAQQIVQGKYDEVGTPTDGGSVNVQDSGSVGGPVATDAGLKDSSATG